MPLGTKVGLGPDTVLGKETGSPKRAQQPPQFSAMFVVAKQLWTQMPLGTQVGLGLGDTVLDGDPAPPIERGTTAPTFRVMSTVVKQSPISATAELLLYSSR